MLSQTTPVLSKPSACTLKSRSISWFFFYCSHADQFLLPKLIKSHKSIINHLLRCPQSDTLPTGTTATCCHMASCQVIIHQCRCKRQCLATRPRLLFLPSNPSDPLPRTSVHWQTPLEQIAPNSHGRLLRVESRTELEREVLTPPSHPPVSPPPSPFPLDVSCGH